MFEGICEALMREMETIEEKVSKGQMNNQDLDHIDKIAHALKSLKTYEAMEGNSEYSGYGSGEGSYARGRSRTTGRYISRDSYDSRDGGSYRRY